MRKKSAEIINYVDAGITFYKQITKGMFLNEQHYETFTKRAEELGLCEHRIKKWMKEFCKCYGQTEYYLQLHVAVL